MVSRKIINFNSCVINLLPKKLNYIQKSVILKCADRTKSTFIQSKLKNVINQSNLRPIKIIKTKKLHQNNQSCLTFNLRPNKVIAFICFFQKNETGIKTKYAQNPRSMQQSEYLSVFFVCQKPHLMDDDEYQNGNGDKPNDLNGHGHH